MNRFKGKIILGGIVIAVLAVFMIYGLSMFTQETVRYESAGPYYFTKVNGLKAGSELHYHISYDQNFRKHYEGNLEKNIKGTVTVANDGSVKLPIMRSYYENYDLYFGEKGNKASLHITKNDHTGRLNIKGKGFEVFSDVFINEAGGEKTIKTDWAGLFSESVLMPQDSNRDAEGVKLAFGGFNIDGISNPAILEVVIAQGGGPTDANVNVYDPPIHDYNCDEPVASSDGDDIFYVSTCDVDRMNQHLEGPDPGTVSYNIAQPMMKMAEQFSAVMMQQMQIIGSFLDAKEQQEAQRDFRTLAAQAHKDYHPSEQMCRFGSYMRSMSDTEEQAEYNKQALNKILVDYYNYQEHMSSSEGGATNTRARLDQFKNTYCNPNDNNGSLWEMCRGQSNIPATNPSPSGTPEERERYNKDIDYFRTLARPLTLNIDFADDVFSADEEDIIALAKNLYWPRVEDMPNAQVYDEGFTETYRLFLKTRSLTSKYNVAHNSFATIVGMKSSSPSTLGPTAGPAYMKSLLRDFGYSDLDIEEVLGENPSYYAQMDFLTKKIYQNPNFYTALYDKPSNVDRINATLESFQLMHGRDRFESQLRQEALMSILVEEALAKRVGEANAKILSLSSRVKPLSGDGAP